MTINKALAPWLVLAAALLWGTTGTAQTLAPAGATPLSVGALRLATGGIAMLVMAVLSGSFRCSPPWPLGTTVAAAVCLALFQPLFFTGLATTGVAVGTVVAIGSSPIFAGLFGLLLRKENPGRNWAYATALAISGCILLFFSGGSVTIHPLGVLYSLGAGLSYAAYTVISKGLLENLSPNAVIAVVFCLAAGLLSPALFTQKLDWVLVPRGLAVVLYMGIVTAALAYSLFSRGLVLIPTATAVTLGLAEPLTAALLGVVVVGEHLTPGSLGGIGLLLLGLLLMVRAPKVVRQSPERYDL